MMAANPGHFSDKSLVVIVGAGISGTPTCSQAGMSQTDALELQGYAWPLI